MLKKIIHKTLSLLFPSCCYGCGAEGDWICAECEARLPVSSPQRCVLCGETGTAGLCAQCRLDTGLSGVVAFFPYQETPVGALLRAAKYHGQTVGLDEFVSQRRRAILSRLPSGAALCPIPLSKKRRLQRGYNQSEIIAWALAGRELDVLLLLSKVRDTQPQAKLDRAGRQQNLQDSFAVSRRLSGRAGEASKLPEIIALVDDVITTGSTLGEAAKVLSAAGVKEIWAVTLAHD